MREMRGNGKWAKAGQPTMLNLRHGHQAVDLDSNAVLPTVRIRADDAPMAAHHAAYRHAHVVGQRDKDVDFAADLKASVGEEE